MFQRQDRNADQIILTTQFLQDSFERRCAKSPTIASSFQHKGVSETAVEMEKLGDSDALGVHSDAWYDTDLLAAEEMLFALEAEVEASLSDLPALEQQHLLVVRQALLSSSKHQQPKSLENMQRQIAAAQSALLLLQLLPDKGDTCTTTNGLSIENTRNEVKPPKANRLKRNVHQTVGRGKRTITKGASCGEGASNYEQR